MAARVAWLQAAQPTLIVLAATGGDHRAVAGRWRRRPARGAASPRLTGHCRDGAVGPTALGLDARAVARVAEAVRPAPRPLRDAQPEERRALLARRRQRSARRTAAQHRLANAPRRLRPALAAPMASPFNMCRYLVLNCHLV